MNKVRKINRVLIVMLCLIILTLLSLLVACNDGGDQDNQNNGGNNLGTVPSSTDCVGDYEMYIDFRVTAEISYYFKPVHSGYYTFTCDNDTMTATIDGKKVKSGNTSYYNKVKRYRIDYKGSGDFAHCYMRPVELNSDAIEIQSKNDCVIKYFCSETGLYNLNTDASKYTILDASYKEVKTEGNDIFFMHKKDNDFNGLYYIVLLNYDPENVNVNCSFDKVHMDTIVLDKSQSELSQIPISGKAGEMQYYLLDVKTNDTYVFNVYGLSGNGVLSSSVCLLNDLTSINPTSLVVGNSHYFYEYSDLQVGNYYLILEFKEDIDARISFDYSGAVHR